MKKTVSKIGMIIVLIGIFTLTFNNNSYCKEKAEIKEVEYSKEYKHWLELTDEQREKTIEPLKYDIKTINKTNNTKNIIKLLQKVKAEKTGKYDLREVIPENMVIRNQKNTSACWAFATIGSLESNLAIKNLKNSTDAKRYDYSEMHMNYASVREAFLNGKVNEKGTNRKVSEGGAPINALMYLTNGSGAIKEEDMPFEDTSENIDISRIQNKEVITTLNEMVLLSSADEENAQQLKNKIKEYIKEFGGIAANIHGNSIGGDCYNNETGAIYCNDEEKYPQDHAVLIIGWDDDYPATNFNEACRPKNNGAWIIKNSWGEKLVYTMNEMKKNIFEANKDKMQELGYTSENDITDEQVEQFATQMKIQKEADGTFSMKLGDNGFMYVSYEDVNINKILWGIKDAEDTKNYKNLYQNDELGTSSEVAFTTEAKRIYIANVFKRDKNIKEEINKISIVTFEQYNNCKVYVNPNGESRKREDVKEIKLKKGNSVSIDPGYSVLEFAEPIELKSDKFAVILEFDNDSKEGKSIPIENNSSEEYKNAVINANESFVGGFEVEESDLGTHKDPKLKGNVCLKAFSQDVTSGGSGTDDPNPPKGENGILSDFSNTNAEMTSGKINIDSEDVEKSYVEAIMHLKNIKRDDNDKAKYKYSYYLSNTKGDKDINEEYWEDIDGDLVKESDGTYSLIIRINTKDLKYNSKITAGDNLYLYVRETAELDNDVKTQINEFDMKFEDEPDIDIDKEKTDPDINSNKTIDTNNYNDPTIANKILPLTGIPVILSTIIVIIAIGTFTYIRYKNIDK